MKGTVTIWIPEGELREDADLSKPFNNGLIDSAKHIYTFYKAWLKGRGYDVRIYPNHAIDVVIEGIDDETKYEMYEASTDGHIWYIPIDPEIDTIINNMVLHGDSLDIIIRRLKNEKHHQ